MIGMLATQSSTPIIGEVARVLGWLMNAIFAFLSSAFNIENIGLCIILFTFIVYTLMIPLTIKQQKFSKLSAKMNPEIQAIQKKYKGKQDQQSMMAMNEETKAVYRKYGTSPTGGCLQLIIQMPILFALYQVINNIPAYVISVKNTYDALVTGIMSTSGYQAIMEEIGKGKNVNPDKFDYLKVETIIDVLYKFNSSDWANLADKFPNLSTVIEQTADKMSHMNSFLGGINISDAPITNLLSVAILIPILSGLTQWLNVKLMPQPQTPSNAEENPMANSMKTMNVMMPVMSAVMSFTLPSGLGLYWIAGSVFRCIQQLVINKYMDSIDLDDLIKKNLDKVNKKRERQGLPQISASAKTNVRSIETPIKNVAKSQDNKQSKANETSQSVSTGKAKPGSIREKANMVKQFNEKNTK
ncbi:MAG: YidC/Oxa1 family membrane protein insertase [Candidatus Galacturonibacter soehngenii]|uniref:YidC/Oxa1 family membrane protein insertase n=2 Tax=Candidatus Galacturonatibacter soehngenii TaxID=2307010 RepID=A0A7V7QHU5_9FIRM|nr:YidC/Oxa1 family membrane protein insertase [Candidatus Galacturonibacter soehngenii]MBA4688365.1 YidC/Oxa1 family membrane protein insertase [Candidatus Galacturonibacter soehngenii]